MITIKDIAKETGFSFKTVSRVVNSEKGVSPHTREIIEEAVNRLGYVVNPMAGGLRSGKTGMVGILTGELNLVVKTAKLYAIQQGLEKSGIPSLLSCLDLSDREECQSLPSFLRMVDGIIILNPPLENHFEEIIKNSRKPILYVDGQSQIYPSIVIDRERGVLDAFSHLQSSYDHFIYLNGMSENREDSRLVSFQKVTSHLDKSKTSREISLSENCFESGFRKGLTLTLNESRRTLILCTNDQMAFGLLKALYRRNIMIPQKVGVLGFDGDEYGSYGYHTLATIKQPVEELGQLAVEVMESLLAKRKTGMNYSIITQYAAGESA